MKKIKFLSLMLFSVLMLSCSSNEDIEVFDDPSFQTKMFGDVDSNGDPISSKVVTPPPFCAVIEYRDLAFKDTYDQWPTLTHLNIQFSDYIPCANPPCLGGGGLPGLTYFDIEIQEGSHGMFGGWDWDLSSTVSYSYLSPSVVNSFSAPFSDFGVNSRNGNFRFRVKNEECDDWSDWHEAPRPTR